MIRKDAARDSNFNTERREARFKMNLLCGIYLCGEYLRNKALLADLGVKFHFSLHHIARRSKRV